MTLWLALRSLYHHKLVSVVTVVGVAIGMLAISSILIVDHNTSQAELALKDAPDKDKGGWLPSPSRASNLPDLTAIHFQRAGESRADTRRIALPDQKQRGKALSSDTDNALGEDDYQAMRLAVRLSSLFAFAIGGVIVFFTMRFSVASRAREFALLVTLGAERRQTAATLLVEALILGLMGIVIGAALAVPAAWQLLAWGVTTTGRSYVAGFEIPMVEVGVLGALGILVALSGVIGPARTLFTQSIRDVLQPRFLHREFSNDDLNTGGFAWLLVPIVLAAYVLVRPFLKDWLSVVYFFVFETAFVLVFALGVLWWVRPLLRGLIGASEKALRKPFPLETLLTGRRMRLASRKFVFTVASVALVFSLLMGLNGITLSLKDEIWRWSVEALYPNTHFTRVRQIRTELDPVVINEIEQNGIAFYRLSPKVKGMLPFRLLDAEDFNRMRAREQKPLLKANDVIVTHTMSERFDLTVGDVLVLETGVGKHDFRVAEISDRYGYVPLSEQYVDMRTYALFSSDHPLFSAFAPRARDFAIARYVDKPQRVPWGQVLKAAPHYQGKYRSGVLGYLQRKEIDRDFLIFDYILGITVLLAMVGIINSMLIQVHAREREFSVYRVIGMSNFQVARLLMVEGVVIGLISALLALVLGLALTWISVEFLDRFTLFSLRTVISLPTLGLTLVGVVFVCSVAALYPARVATRISSAESLHYE